MISATLFAVALASPLPSQPELGLCPGSGCDAPTSMLASLSSELGAGTEPNTPPARRVGKRVKATRSGPEPGHGEQRRPREVPGAPQRIWFQDEPASDLRFASTLPGGDEWPLLSFGGPGAGTTRFCVIEDAKCGVSLLLDADIGAGVELASALDNYSIPYTQYRVRAGATFRPITLARNRWTPWTLGMAVSWSEGSRTLGRDQRSSETDQQSGLRELDAIRSLRVTMVNQLWLTQRRFAPHIDLSIGGVHTSVLDAHGRYWGTTVELGVGFGGFASVFASMDILDRNFRGVLGFRSHAIAATPIAALVILGLLAGGAV